MWRLCGLTLLALLSVVLFLGAWANAQPLPIEVDDDEAHEVEANVTPSAKAVVYSVHFAHIPSTVTAEDFSARVIANKVLKISALGASIDWHFTLAEAIPQGYKFIPAVEVDRLPGDPTGAVWRTIVVIPKTFQRLPVSVPLPKREEAPQATGSQGAPQGGLRGGPSYGWRSIPGGQPAVFPWAEPVGQEARAIPTMPRHVEKALPSASVPESMPLPSFDN